MDVWFEAKTQSQNRKKKSPFTGKFKELKHFFKVKLFNHEKYL